VGGFGGVGGFFEFGGFCVERGDRESVCHDWTDDGLGGERAESFAFLVFEFDFEFFFAAVFEFFHDFLMAFFFFVLEAEGFGFLEVLLGDLVVFEQIAFEFFSEVVMAGFEEVDSGFDFVEGDLVFLFDDETL
jgi:hypothetical protein